MGIKEFNELFGLKSTIDDEKKKFVNRINIKLFDPLYSIISVEYKKMFENICYELGENSQEQINRFSPDWGNVPTLTFLTKNNFIKTLQVVVALYECYSSNSESQEAISNIVNDALSRISTDIGVKWKDGIFYPSGEKVLDKELIEKSLEILNDYPNEKIDLKNALENYYKNSSYGVVDNCYKAMEGLVRQLLGNGKTLLVNKVEILQKLNFSESWKKMVANYLEYANENHRHAGENRHDLKPNEVEAFLYLTCLLIRAMAKTKE